MDCVELTPDGKTHAHSIDLISVVELRILFGQFIIAFGSGEPVFNAISFAIE